MEDLLLQISHYYDQYKICPSAETRGLLIESYQDALLVVNTLPEFLARPIEQAIIPKLRELEAKSHLMPVRSLKLVP